jgi:hypothetical protein
VALTRLDFTWKTKQDEIVILWKKKQNGMAAVMKKECKL